MNKFKILVISVSVLLFSCTAKNTSENIVTTFKPSITTTEEQRWVQMTGKWYSSQPTTTGGLKQHTVERFVDGTYEINFKTTGYDGVVRDSIEVGNWGVSGNIYFTTFRGWLNGKEFKPSDPSNPYSYDAYNIISLTDEYFEYESLGSKNNYKIIKVKNDFVIP